MLAVPEEEDQDSQAEDDSVSTFSFDSESESCGSDRPLSQDKEFTFRKFQFREVDCRGTRPKPRSGHRIVHYKGRLFSFGGYNPSISQDDEEMAGDAFWQESRPLFKELWELNLSTAVWTKCEMKGEIPEQLASHTAVRHPLQPDTMLVYGGTGAPFGFTTSNTVVACRLDSSQFGALECREAGPDQLPLPLYGQAVVTDNRGRFFTVGGTSGFTYFMDVNLLDLSREPPVWSCLYRQAGAGVRDEPEPRYRHELCLWQDQLYVLGGGTSFSADRFEDLPTFNIAERRWFYTRTKADLTTTIDLSEDGYPEARRCHSAVQVRHIVWIFGGYDGDEVFGDCWQLDLLTMQWTRLRLELPVPVYFHAMTLTEEGKMVMFGGVDDIENNTRTNSVWTAWLTVPSLRSLAWEAVCHYQPGLAALPAARLLQEGVPADCVSLVSSPSQASWG